MSIPLPFRERAAELLAAMPPQYTCGSESCNRASCAWLRDLRAFLNEVAGPESAVLPVTAPEYQP